jgi:two-component system chemotaxis response regulator CheY
MLVDDSRFMHTYITNIIEKLGHKVIGTAQNGREAISQYVKLKPDLVFMDVIMDDISGITAVEKIMGLDKDARIVMCSAMGQEIIIKEAIREGAKDFIVKPFQSNDIKTSIEKYAKK